MTQEVLENLNFHCKRIVTDGWKSTTKIFVASTGLSLPQKKYFLEMQAKQNITILDKNFPSKAKPKQDFHADEKSI